MDGGALWEQPIGGTGSCSMEWLEGQKGCRTLRRSSSGNVGVVRGVAEIIVVVRVVNDAAEYDSGIVDLALLLHCLVRYHS